MAQPMTMAGLRQLLWQNVPQHSFPDDMDSGTGGPRESEVVRRVQNAPPEDDNRRESLLLSHESLFQVPIADGDHDNVDCGNVDENEMIVGKDEEEEYEFVYSKPVTDQPLAKVSALTHMCFLTTYFHLLKSEDKFLFLKMREFS